MKQPSFLVNFVVAGAQKSGTSALDSYLRQHPDIGMAKAKEVHFFDSESSFAGVPDYSRYHEFFPQSPEIKLRGESTPIYLYWYPAPRRMWEYNPRLKIVVLLRNPIERAFSHWNMERARKAESLDFSEALRFERQRCRQALPLQHRIYSYLDRGFYSEQLRRLWHFFPRDQTLVIRHEALRDQHQATMDGVFRFLGVQPIALQAVDIHSRFYERKMLAQERAFLIDFFRLEIFSLEALLGWDCNQWLNENVGDDGRLLGH